MEETKMCSRCKEIKTIDNFSKYRDGLKSHCKACASKYYQNYKENLLKKVSCNVCGKLCVKYYVKRCRHRGFSEN